MSFFKLILSNLIGSKDREDMKTADIIYVYTDESHLYIGFRKRVIKQTRWPPLAKLKCFFFRSKMHSLF